MGPGAIGCAGTRGEIASAADRRVTYYADLPMQTASTAAKGKNLLREGTGVDCLLAERVAICVAKAGAKAANAAVTGDRDMSCP